LTAAKDIFSLFGDALQYNLLALSLVNQNMDNKIEEKKYHTVRTVPNSIIKYQVKVTQVNISKETENTFSDKTTGVLVNNSY
jgi:hypothetical protein